MNDTTAFWMVLKTEEPPNKGNNPQCGTRTPPAINCGFCPRKLVADLFESVRSSAKIKTKGGGR